MYEVFEQYFAPWWAHAVFAAALLLGVVPGVMNRAGRLLRRVAAKWLGPELLVFTFSIALSCVPPVMGWLRPPLIHDEVSYLFAGETFARGRLTNPTPPVWEAFQTFHQIMTPTYASKFPPGQGLTLAAGMLVGSPRVGLIVVIALACAATCWLARACVSAPWAIVCGLIAAVHPLVYTWGQIYWGGGLSMLGGALFAGAMLRLWKDLRSAAPRSSRLTQNGAIAAIGLAVLGLSRPFEGTLLAIFLGVWLIAGAIRQGRLVRLLKQSLPPALLVLLPVAAWMGYYNHRVTGSALTMPYAVHAKQYMRAPLFWWQPLNTPTVPMVPHLRGFFEGSEFREYDDQRVSIAGFFAGLRHKVFVLTRDTLRQVLPAIALLLGAGVLFRKPQGRLALVTIVGVLVVHFSLTPWMRSGYLGPLMPLSFALLAMCLRHCWRLKVRNVSVAPPLALAAIVTWASVSLALQKIESGQSAPAHVRQNLIDSLHNEPGNHIVFVYYLAGAQHPYEWVHNSPDLASQRVIFAHMIDNPTNRRVRDAYPGRKLWLFQLKGLDARFDPMPDQLLAGN